MPKKNFQEKQEKGESFDSDHPPFIGDSLLIKNLKQTLKGVTIDPEPNVLIVGETGVGKNLAATFLHANSIKRKHYPLQVINIYTISKEFITLELFGYQKGSFLGAAQDTMGLLELGNKGIIFFDDIGDLSLESQAILLNFLENKTITPLGTKKNIRLDVQILAATNKNLLNEVQKGNFREDLFHRLNGFVISIPPLRERREDILHLIAHFRKIEIEQLPYFIDANILDFFTNQCTWAGNIRQLSNTVSSMFLQMQIRGLTKINEDCLPDGFFKLNSQTMPISQIGLQQHIGNDLKNTTQVPSISVKGQENQHSSKRRILIVDDDEKFHKTIRFLFKSEYFEFISIYSTDDIARTFEKESNISLVLLDLVFGDSDRMVGLELIPVIRTRFNDVPIVVITSDYNPNTQAEAFLFGAMGFILKKKIDYKKWNPRFEELMDQYEDRLFLRNLRSKHINSFLIYTVYHSEDYSYFTTLRKHLQALNKMYSFVQIWDRESLEAGEDMLEFQEKKISESDIIFILTSADLFAAADTKEEVEKILKLNKLIYFIKCKPNLIEPFISKDNPNLIVLPSSGTPLSQAHDMEQEILHIVRNIQTLIESRLENLKLLIKKNS